MMKLIKPYHIVYRDGSIIMEVRGTGGVTTPGAGTQYAEFDSEAELNAFIADNGLQVREVMDDYGQF